MSNDDFSQTGLSKQSISKVPLHAHVVLKRKDFDSLFISYIKKKDYLSDFYKFACILVNHTENCTFVTKHYTQEKYDKDRAYIDGINNTEKYSDLFKKLYETFLTPEIIKDTRYASLLKNILSQLELRTANPHGGTPVSAAWKNITDTIYGSENTYSFRNNRDVPVGDVPESADDPIDDSTETSDSWQKWQQIIVFGPPGSGKSEKVDNMLSKTDNVFRTTFHPDYDYSHFVGAYKPMTINKKDGEQQIIYDYMPQVFLDAYISAWKNVKENPIKTSILVIEEINRGNCAQIFGDIFQLLDRDNGHRSNGENHPERKGYSRFPIKANYELAEWLNRQSDWKKSKPSWLEDDQLCLPPNFSIIATMNTSDQSLFPMDSAFRRRWQWEYVPIDLSEDENNNRAASFLITIGDKKYSWIKFLSKVNPKILQLTSSEDKQMGTFFITGSVGEEEFVSKVIFYLWNDVCKEEYHGNQDNFMRTNCRPDERNEFTFNELFSALEGRSKLLQGFMEFLGVEPKKEGTSNNAEVSVEGDGNRQE